MYQMIYLITVTFNFVPCIKGFFSMCITNSIGNFANVEEEEIKSTITVIEPSSSPDLSIGFGDVLTHSVDNTGSTVICTACENSLPPFVETSYSVSESDASTTISTTMPIDQTTTTPTISTTPISIISNYVSTSSCSTISATSSYPTTISTSSYPTTISTSSYPTTISTTSCSTISSTTSYPISISTTSYTPTISATNYPQSSDLTTATSIQNSTDRSSTHNLSGDVGLIFGGIIGSLSLITIVLITVILIHKRIHHRRGSSYRPKSKGVKVLPNKDNVGNYKASKVLGRRYEDIDLTEGLSENVTQNDEALTETHIENHYYVDPKPSESVEAADSIYHHLGGDNSSEPVRDDTYHHIDVNFQPCQSSTNEYKNQTDSERGKDNNNYDHIHLTAFKSGVQNPNYNHIEMNNISSEKCDSNYDHISVPHQVSSNHRRNNNYHHIEL